MVLLPVMQKQQDESQSQCLHWQVHSVVLYEQDVGERFAQHYHVVLGVSSTCVHQKNSQKKVNFPLVFLKI